MQRTLQKFVALIALAVWVASLCFATLDTGEPWDDGWWILVIGWMGILEGYPDWFANPVLLVLLFRIALGKLHATTDLALSSFLIVVIFLNLTRTSIVANEGGVSQNITDWYSGFYLWVSSLGLGALLGFHNSFRANAEAKSQT